MHPAESPSILRCRIVAVVAALGDVVEEHSEAVASTVHPSALPRSANLT